MSLLLRSWKLQDGDPDDPGDFPATITTPKPYDLTISQRMLSAGVGSVLTAFVLTPFDVIRIRMQQQELLPDKPCCSVHFPNAHTGPVPVSQTQLPKSPSNLTNSTANITKNPMSLKSEHLFWLDKNYCKTVENCSRIDSTFQGFSTIARNEGLPTLWRGISLTLLMAVPANVIYFTGYEYIRDKSPLNGSINSLLCGAVARLMAATSIAPLELLKTRLQSIPSSRSNPGALKKVVRGAWSEVQTRGLGTLFKGLQITLWRDVPFSGIYWLLYEISKREFGELLGADFTKGKHAENDGKVFATSFVSGSLAGTAAAVCTHPFDVGKTRLQISEATGAPQRVNMFKYMNQIYKNEGLNALFGGLGPRVLKVAPACAIMISSYEISKVFFKSV